MSLYLNLKHLIADFGLSFTNLSSFCDISEISSESSKKREVMQNSSVDLHLLLSFFSLRRTSDVLKSFLFLFYPHTPSFL